MQNLFEKAKKLLLYGSQDKAVLYAIEPDIMEENCRLLRLYSIMAAVIFFVLFVLSYHIMILQDTRVIYGTACLVSGAFVALSSINHPTIRRYLPHAVVLALFLILIFGIVLSVNTSNETPTISFIILLFASPLLFTLLPWQPIAINLVCIAIYLVVGYQVQVFEMYRFNLINLTIYGITSLVVGIYVSQIRIERFVALRENRRLSERDQLTGLLNRRCYESHLKEISLRTDRQNIKVCMIDVNGLKRANDTLGHAAGDALIIGAGDCLTETYGNYGESYRIGGDEYAVIIDSPAPDCEELKAMLKACAAKWDGYPNLKLSLSIGIAQGGECNAMNDVTRLADKRMYADKERHYRESGEDRRKGRA